MELYDFEKRLADFAETLAKAGNKVSPEMLKSTFGDLDLTEEQMLLLLKYLREKGIQPSGGTPAAEDVEIGKEFVIDTPLPGTPQNLSPEDRIYLEAALKEYREDIPDKNLARRLTEAAEIAAALNCQEIPFPDLLQEANLLALTLSQENPVASSEWGLNAFRTKLREELIRVIDGQVAMRHKDSALVRKVEKLDNAVRELTEDEDPDASRFGLEELAILLDMTPEEIRDILRLTGDDV